MSCSPWAIAEVVDNVMKIIYCCSVCIGCQMLHLLVSSGIRCSYILINSLSFVMKQVIALQQIFITQHTCIYAQVSYLLLRLFNHLL